MNSKQRFLGSYELTADDSVYSSRLRDLVSSREVMMQDWRYGDTYHLPAAKSPRRPTEHRTKTISLAAMLTSRCGNAVTSQASFDACPLREGCECL